MFVIEFHIVGINGDCVDFAAKAFVGISPVHEL